MRFRFIEQGGALVRHDARINDHASDLKARKEAVVSRDTDRNLITVLSASTRFLKHVSVCKYLRRHAVR